ACRARTPHDCKSSKSEGTFPPSRTYYNAHYRRAQRSAHKESKECPMALAHAIAEHLPYLRRYARALCGTQKSGDAYVRACLETIVADPSVIGGGTHQRVEVV